LLLFNINILILGAGLWKSRRITVLKLTPRLIYE